VSPLAKKKYLELGHKNEHELKHYKEKFELEFHAHATTQAAFHDFKVHAEAEIHGLKHHLQEMQSKFAHMEHEYHEMKAKFDHLVQALEHEKHEHHEAQKEIADLKIHIHEYKEYIEKDKVGDHEMHEQIIILKKENAHLKHEL